MLRSMEARLDEYRVMTLSQTVQTKGGHFALTTRFKQQGFNPKLIMYGEDGKPKAVDFSGEYYR